MAKIKITAAERKAKLVTSVLGVIGYVGDLSVEDIVSKLGGTVANKQNEAGDVFCNYFQAYLPSEDFATKKNKKDEDVFKSMSKAGEKLHKASARAIASAESEVLTNMRSGEIDVTEANELFDAIDLAKEVKFEVGTTELPTDFPYSVA